MSASWREGDVGELVVEEALGLFEFVGRDLVPGSVLVPESVLGGVFGFTRGGARRLGVGVVEGRIGIGGGRGGHRGIAPGPGAVAAKRAAAAAGPG